MKLSFYRKPGTLALLAVAGVLNAGCGAENGADEPGGFDGADAQPFDLSDVGIRGMIFEGDAVVLAEGLEFPDTRAEFRAGHLTVSTGSIELDGYDDPEIEFRDEPVRMRMRLLGQVSQEEPGEVQWTITRVRPSMIDSDDQALGTNSAEEALEALRANGVEVPEVGDEEIEVTLTVEASDEDYSEISIRSDWEHFQHFTGTRSEDEGF